MALAWNTRELLSESKLAPIPIEYHFLSRRELYDSVVTADQRDRLGGWAVYGDNHWYTVEVVSRPIDVLPQELCLSFDCFPRTEIFGDGHTMSGPPDEEIAVEFGMLLSLLIREALLPIGIRRQGGRPIRIDSPLGNFSRFRSRHSSVPLGVNSRELRAIIEGLAKAKEADANAVLAASRLYHAALLLSEYDVSTAYFSLVSAIECVSGHHFKKRCFEFDDIEKFRRVRETITELSCLPDTADLLDDLKRKMLDQEHFVWQKFRDFIEEFLPEEFWQLPDIVQSLNLFKIEKPQLRKFLRKAYDARSSFAHAGEPFPAHVEIGLYDGASVRPRSVVEMAALPPTKAYVPTFPWFERVTWSVLREYLHRVIATDLPGSREDGLEELPRRYPFAPSS